MKLKATKYLLPTTDGRLHKELSYLISLHENKMTKGKIKNRLDELENKLNEMSHALSMMYNSIESSEQLFENDETCNAPEPITSTTLKTPNEWLKLMSDDECIQWWKNRNKADGWELDMDKEYTFEDMIIYSFHWLSSPEQWDYWQNLSNRYNN